MSAKFRNYWLYTVKALALWQKVWQPYRQTHRHQVNLHYYRRQWSLNCNAVCMNTTETDDLWKGIPLKLYFCQCHIRYLASIHFIGFSNTWTESSLGWLSWSSLVTLELAFNVPRDVQGIHLLRLLHFSEYALWLMHDRCLTASDCSETWSHMTQCYQGD